jgi:NhaP-type Na+/H+ or K+/H+ antiporter
LPGGTHLSGAGSLSADLGQRSPLSDRTLSVVIMTVIVVALVATLVVAIRRAPKAADIDAETRQEEVEIPLRPGAGTMIGSGAVPASEEVRAAERRRVEQPL